MLKNLLNSIEEKYNTRKQENNNLNNLLNTTSTFQNLFPMPSLTNEISDYKVSLITSTCPDINEEKAKLISKLIPIKETYLSVHYIKEVLTNQEYYLILTDKYIWVINQNNYGAFQYETIKCSIIKNNMMSKTILLNNILIEVNGTNTTIEDFINTINDKDYRVKKINDKTSYLCGIIPIYQHINSIFSGISIDNNNTIVFHANNKHYKYSINEIENCEILLDNQVYTSSKITNSTSIGSFHNTCYQISIRVTITNKQLIIIPILNPNNFGTKYDSHDSTFKKNLEFANTILEKIKELKPPY